MDYQITSDNITVSDSMKELAQSKFSKLDGRLKEIPDGSKSIRIVMNSAPDETFEIKAEAIINGKQYFAHETDFSMESAMVLVVEELHKQLEKAEKMYEQKWEENREAKRFPVE
ncbi:MAG: hypothetical protein UU77_C0001G0005 [candidate division WWE3 bacterium GW2011_GWC1_41_7]|uniref:Ribosomal subunit interface protein n=4 Tax=Katanobacteria TaxID=422282 RepID=A0A0G0X982_UNCKA|nr:MAG: hypothetical protein UU72_C0003G0006 [candidate division WWE3 bacterium GW2011_GWB1_41_6]KKS21510.1 MAG: hypothetical protein UU77_C0001G0005 [candidate division WWE3 bacterium GW2011_GWC1_41_7]KKS22531.1 MAG: hypothetical protein UU80_C0006G0057 [candidate division WWE3 bacterium GW2011_GWA1_41_8]OGC57880.1 MAG: hypothetical protein A2976_03305 [candidate division WWE3 bacterium RIFCSPLOWO2_01_FULL_41_9]